MVDESKVTEPPSADEIVFARLDNAAVSAPSEPVVSVDEATASTVAIWVAITRLATLLSD